MIFQSYPKYLMAAPPPRSRFLQVPGEYVGTLGHALGELPAAPRRAASDRHSLGMVIIAGLLA